MACRFANRIRPSVLAATTATVIEALYLRTRNLPVNSRFESHQHVPREPVVTFPSFELHSDFHVPPMYGSGHPQIPPLFVHSLPSSEDHYRLFVPSSRKMSAGGDDKRNSKERPADRENLLNILHYAEIVMPRLFEESLFLLKYNQPALYTPNVILENHLRTPVKTTTGIPSLTLHLGLFRMNYVMRYMLRKLIILNTWVDEAEATVNIHFRVLCCRRPRLIGTSPFTVDEKVRQALAEKAEWHEYILTLHVTNRDRVWKVVITQKASDRPPRVHRPIRSLLGRMRRRLLPQPALPIPV